LSRHLGRDAVWKCKRRTKECLLAANVAADFLHNIVRPVGSFIYKVLDKKRRNGHGEGKGTNYEKLQPHGSSLDFGCEIGLQYRNVVQSASSVRTSNFAPQSVRAKNFRLPKESIRRKVLRQPLPSRRRLQRLARPAPVFPGSQGNACGLMR